MKRKWFRVVDETYNFKPHFVCAELAEDVGYDLSSRDKTTVITKEPAIDQILIDLPGMVMTHRHYRYVDLDGLKLEIPDQDWSTLLYHFEKSIERKFDHNEQIYYKLYTTYFCIVLTPMQYFNLITKMEDEQEEADKQADLDNKRFVQAMEEINEGAAKKGRAGVVSARAIAVKNKERNKKFGAN